MMRARPNYRRGVWGGRHCSPNFFLKLPTLPAPPPHPPAPQFPHRRSAPAAAPQAEHPPPGQLAARHHRAPARTRAPARPRRMRHPAARKTLPALRAARATSLPRVRPRAAAGYAPPPHARRPTHGATRCDAARRAGPDPPADWRSRRAGAEYAAPRQSMRPTAAPRPGWASAMRQACEPVVQPHCAHYPADLAGRAGRFAADWKRSRRSPVSRASPPASRARLVRQIGQQFGARGDRHFRRRGGRGRAPVRDEINQRGVGLMARPPRSAAAGRRRPRAARLSSLNAIRSSRLPPPRATISTSGRGMPGAGRRSMAAMAAAIFSRRALALHGHGIEQYRTGTKRRAIVVWMSCSTAPLAEVMTPITAGQQRDRALCGRRRTAPRRPGASAGFQCAPATRPRRRIPGVRTTSWYSAAVAIGADAAGGDHLHPVLPASARRGRPTSSR